MLVGNFLDWLAKPTVLLQQMNQLVNRGGILMCTNPYSWKAEFTAKSEWLGSQKGQSSQDATAEVLHEVGFKNLSTHEMQLAIRHHARFYELIGAQSAIWQRK